MEEMTIEQYCKDVLKKTRIEIVRHQAAYQQIAKEKANYKKLLVPDLTIQFLNVVDFIDQLPMLSPTDKILPFFFEDNLMALMYDGFSVYIIYKRTLDSIARKAADVWTNVFQDVADVDWGQRQAFFYEGNGGIVNIYPDTHKLLKQKEEALKKQIEKYKGAELAFQFMPRHITNKTAEIQDYALQVFSLIEFIGNAILPYWENANNPEWSLFLEYVKRKNPSINNWADLYNASLVTSRRSENRDGRIPAETYSPMMINVIDGFFSAIKKKNPSINKLYFSLKKLYRNSLNHGCMSSNYNFGVDILVPNVLFCSDVNTIKQYAQVGVNNAISSLDFHAFIQIRDFFWNFMDFIAKEYPAFTSILEKADFLPIGEDLCFFKDLTDSATANAWLKNLHTVQMVQNLEHNWEILKANQSRLDSTYQMLMQCCSTKQEMEDVMNKLLKETRKDLPVQESPEKRISSYDQLIDFLHALNLNLNENELETMANNVCNKLKMAKPKEIG